MKKKVLVFGLLMCLMLPAAVDAQWVVSNYGSLPAPTTGGITGIIKNIMNWLLILLGIFGVIGFVIAGILYLTAAGNEDQMKKGKNAMTWSIIGIVVGLMGYVIIQAADKMLSATAGF
ncbi:MAG: pilin [Candidatus Moraniibacteriota bacterium]